MATDLQPTFKEAMSILESGKKSTAELSSLKNKYKQSIDQLARITEIKSKSMKDWKPPKIPALKSRYAKELSQLCTVVKTKTCPLQVPVFETIISIYWTSIIPTLNELDFAIIVASDGDPKQMKQTAVMLMPHSRELESAVSENNAKKDAEIERLKKDCHP